MSTNETFTFNKCTIVTKLMFALLKVVTHTELHFTNTTFNDHNTKVVHIKSLTLTKSFLSTSDPNKKFHTTKSLSLLFFTTLTKICVRYKSFYQSQTHFQSQR